MIIDDETIEKQEQDAHERQFKIIMKFRLEQEMYERRQKYVHGLNNRLMPLKLEY